MKKNKKRVLEIVATSGEHKGSLVYLNLDQYCDICYANKKVMHNVYSKSRGNVEKELYCDRHGLVYSESANLRRYIQWDIDAEEPEIPEVPEVEEPEIPNIPEEPEVPEEPEPETPNIPEEPEVEVPETETPGE